MSCIFCRIRDKEILHGIVYEDDICLAFLDRAPVNPGHLLLIPKLHEPDYWNLDESLFQHLTKVGYKLSLLLKQEYSPEKVGFVLSGFEVPHVHIHLTPLHTDQDFTAEKKVILSVDEMEQIAQQLRNKLI